MRDGKTIGLAVLGLVALIVGAVAFTRCQNTKKYDDARRWRQPAYSSTDPFGYAVFDSIMTETLPNGYEVLKTSLDSLNPKEWKDRSLLYMPNYSFLVDTDGEKIESLVNEGCRVLVVTDNVGSDLEREWKLNIKKYDYFYFGTFKRSLESKDLDSLVWKRPSDTPAVYHITSGLVVASIVGDDPQAEYMARIAANRYVAVKVMSNKKGGALIVATTPLLLTNYGILDDEISRFDLRLMEQIANRPVTRVQSPYSFDEYRQREDESVDDGSSFLSYFLSNTPLRTALYIALAALVLLTVMHARRRQRVIPVKQAPKNHSLEFVQIVGNIYYNRGDYLSLLKMKYTYFAEELRRRLMIDIDDKDADLQNINLLASKTGLAPEFIRQTILDARQQIIVEDADVLELIDQMNKILKAL